MSNFQERVSEFNLVGQLIGFVIKDGYKLKYLRINFAEREYWIKPIKEIREQIKQTITPGCWVEVQGIRKQCFKTGKVKLKADSVKLLNSVNSEDMTVSLVSAPTQTAKSLSAKASILVCQKSDCWKRGGQTICRMLNESLRDRGLEDKVQVKLTGCLKQCKHGPNVVMMPDKARYSQVQPEHVAQLLENHF
jgi:(2Fe-2S) ferredoxin